MGSVLQRSWDFMVHEEGSSRPAALIRMGLVLLVWTRYAEDFLLYKNLEPTTCSMGSRSLWRALFCSSEPSLELQRSGRQRPW